MKDKVLGSWGEAVAEEHLRGRGYDILEKNYRTRALDEFERPLGEADLVAERDGILVFAEVRSRRTRAFGAPEETVTGVKRRRIVHAAEDYLTRNQIHDRMVRFDVIAVTKGAAVTRVEHIEDAFDAGH